MPARDGDASGGYVISRPLTLAKGVSACTWRRVALTISSARRPCTSNASAINQRVDSCAQRRDELPLEPGMMLEPRLIARRRVGQRHVSRSVRLPGPDRCGRRRLAAAAEKVTLGVLSDEQRQFDPGQASKELVEP